MNEVSRKNCVRSLLKHVTFFASAAIVSMLFAMRNAAAAPISASPKNTNHAIALLFVGGIELGALAWTVSRHRTKTKRADLGQPKISSGGVIQLLILVLLGLFMFGVHYFSSKLHRLPWDGFY